MLGVKHGLLGLASMGSLVSATLYGNIYEASTYAELAHVVHLCETHDGYMEVYEFTALIKADIALEGQLLVQNACTLRVIGLEPGPSPGEKFTLSIAPLGSGYRGHGHFRVQNGHLEIDNLHLTGAETFKGAVENNGADLIIRDSVFSNNVASNYGGAVYSDAREQYHYSTTLINVVFRENSSGDQGGAIMQNSGRLSLTNVEFEGNTAPDGANIYVRGGILIFDCDLSLDHTAYDGIKVEDGSVNFGTVEHGIAKYDNAVDRVNVPANAELGFDAATGLTVDGNAFGSSYTACPVLNERARKCDDGYWSNQNQQDESPSPCSACPDNSFCRSAVFNEILPVACTNGFALADMPNDNPDWQGTLCVPCDDPPAGHFAAPPATTVDAFLGSCVLSACNTTCRACDSADSCTSCSDNYGLYYGECVSCRNPPKGLYVIERDESDAGDCVIGNCEAAGKCTSLYDPDTQKNGGIEGIIIPAILVPLLVICSILAFGGVVLYRRQSRSHANLTSDGKGGTELHSDI